MLSNELLDDIGNEYPCRKVQLKQLATLIGDDSIPSPQAFVVHGLEATGKTTVLRKFLNATDSSFTWVPCNECITVRHLTERIAATVSEALSNVENHPRCENISVLAVYLQRILDISGTKHFLVLDRIDRQRDAPATLLASLRRIGEMIPNLTVIFVVSVPHPRLFSSAELPHVHFTPYSKDESIEILSKEPLRIFDDDEDYTEELAQEELYVWQKFCATVWDSLAKGAARDVVQFRDTVEKNWKPFVKPIAAGEYGTRNYSSLYLLNKDMFRREDTVIDSVVPISTDGYRTVKSHDLPYYSKFILCASYLASFNPARLDVQFFMKANDAKKKRRGGGGGGKQGKTRKIQRRLLGPQAFPIERMLAIFHSIIPQDIEPTSDIMAQIATLTSLRLLVKASSLDPLDGSARWKVNVEWEYIRGIARSVKFDIEDRMAE
ncbi:origin recognition complex subunit 5 C-terminus-domain-containing protein [Geopyxis carbonaria]|nr:origin recognition complex subunit 5 C-terminus-domain-containing protein [Geopyxis carbonaria]